MKCPKLIIIIILVKNSLKFHCIPWIFSFKMTPQSSLYVAYFFSYEGNIEYRIVHINCDVHICRRDQIYKFCFCNLWSPGSNLKLKIREVSENCFLYGECQRIVFCMEFVFFFVRVIVFFWQSSVLSRKLFFFCRGNSFFCQTSCFFCQREVVFFTQ